VSSRYRTWEKSLDLQSASTTSVEMCEVPRSTALPKDSRGYLGRKLFHNARAIYATLLVWFGTSIFSILLILAGHHVLLKGIPEVGTLYLTASTTNLLVSVFSQIFTKLALFNIDEVLHAFRWQLATQRNGVSAPTFFQLSSGTGWWSIFQLLVTSKLTKLWGLARYAFSPEDDGPCSGDLT
jgi:hypothetical protein